MARRAAQQLFAAGTSVGANYQESRNASSRRDYLARQEIVLREVRESLFWLKLIESSGLAAVPAELVREADALVAIFTKSTQTVKMAMASIAKR